MCDNDASPDDTSTFGSMTYTCEECDSFIDPTSWTPVEGVDVDGEVRIYRFCDQSCREEWRSD